MAARPASPDLAPSRGVAAGNWLVRQATGLVSSRTSRRGFLVRSAMAGSALAVAGWRYASRPGTAYGAIAACPPGSLCSDGFTEFCCVINDGINACPPGTFNGGWWRADFSQYCNGTRYYIDCMQDCCGAPFGSQWCNGCTPCHCPSCNNRKVFCNYFRYGQCNQHIVRSGPIACRVATCVPPYEFDPACSAASAVDNSTADHFSDCLLNPPLVYPPPPPVSVLASVGSAVLDATGTMWVFVRGADAGVHSRTFDGTTWSDWVALGGITASRINAIVYGSDIWVFARGYDQGLWYRRFSGGAWQAWQSLGPTVTSDPSPVELGGDLYVFVKGVDHGLWYRRLTGGAWQPWRTLGPTISTDPVAASDGSAIWVFATAPDYATWYRRLPAGGSWGPWTSLGRTVTSDPAAVVEGSGLWAFGRGADLGLWYRRHGGGSWSGWTTLGPTMTSNPSAVVHDGGLYAFVRGSDDGLWYRVSTGGSWSGWAGLGPTISTDPLPVSHPGGLFVFAEGRDRALWYRRLTSGGWSAWESLGGVLQSQRGNDGY